MVINITGSGLTPLQWFFVVVRIGTDTPKILLHKYSVMYDAIWALVCSERQPGIQIWVMVDLTYPRDLSWFW